MGVAIVPASIQSVLKNKVVYRNIRNNKFSTTTALAWESENRSPTVHAFINVVKESKNLFSNQYDC